MSLRFNSISVIFFSLILFTITNNAFANTEKSKISIPHLKASIDFDGELNEEVWQQAKKFDLNIVNYPYENTPTDIKTEAFIFEDGERIYVAFKAFDPEPEKIQGFLRDRDDAFADDIVGIKLDTFNNHRLAYKFFVNPFGVQNDGISNEMTGEDSNLWDAIWQSNGKLTDEGYQVEFAIPYSELNFEEGEQLKTWGVEFIRIYPRDTILRISHIPLDRDNACWVCQMQEIQGFEKAKLGQNLLVTPSLVTSKSEDRDIEDGTDWQSDNDSDIGLSLRWGITPDIMLNATINPDFSTVESDSGQLSVNKKYALFYDEKRPFFLDNSEYFSTEFDLVYTRNIADPDFGTKITGSVDNQSFGFFMTKDNLTNIILPGNTISVPDTIEDESYSGALRYRYDFNDDFYVGYISTMRTADDYHNLVNGIDTRYRFDVSNSFNAQILTSATEYPEQLYQRWCSEQECYLTGMVGKNDGQFTGQAYNLEFEHESENWTFSTEYEVIDKDFRADLGYMPKVDVNTFESELTRSLYSESAFWTKMDFGAEYEIIHNNDGELIDKTSSLFFSIDGPMQSFMHLTYLQKDSIGLREDFNNADIDDNSTLFNQNFIELYLAIQPRSDIFLSMFTVAGDAIDYDNDRLGDLIELSPSLVWNLTKHLELNLNYTYAKLEADGSKVYKEDIYDTRLTYQFDVNSYLRLNTVLVNSEFNESNNPSAFIDSSEEKDLSTQLIYSYKLNPQTVFFLGYSDHAFEDRRTRKLKQDQRTAFLKLSYAWM